MPMFFSRRDVHDVSYADDLVARFRGDNTLAGSDKQHLIAAMDVHLVARAGAEINDGKIKVIAHLGGEQRLSRHGPPVNKGLFAGSAGIVSGLSTFTGHPP